MIAETSIPKCSSNSLFHEALLFKMSASPITEHDPFPERFAQYQSPHSTNVTAIRASTATASPCSPWHWGVAAASIPANSANSALPP